MRRTLTILAATALAAAITIPAVAQGGGDRQDPAVARLTSCLTAHGVTVPSGLDPVALKQWLGARLDDQTVAAALKACSGGDGTQDKAGGCGSGKPAPPGSVTKKPRG
jgi:hypothetical protein